MMLMIIAIICNDKNYWNYWNYCSLLPIIAISCMIDIPIITIISIITIIFRPGFPRLFVIHVWLHAWSVTSGTSKCMHYLYCTKKYAQMQCRRASILADTSPARAWSTWLAPAQFHNRSIPEPHTGRHRLRPLHCWKNQLELAQVHQSG